MDIIPFLSVQEKDYFLIPDYKILLIFRVTKLFFCPLISSKRCEFDHIEVEKQRRKCAKFLKNGVLWIFTFLTI